MPIIVQKFGGTSVADSKKSSPRPKGHSHQLEGNQVVMVVSAIGKNTELLVDLAKEITDEPPAREMDMLLSTGEQVSVALMAMAITSLGHKAISLTGADRHHHRQQPHQGPHPLDFDGADSPGVGRGEHRDRGRVSGDRRGEQHHHARPRRQRHHGRRPGGGVAADACEIYTNVDGVYSTDPRIVPEARRVKRISYDEMLELATAGAG